MIGEVAKDRLVVTSGAQVGDDLLLTKGIAVEGTAILAREREGFLRSRGYAEAFIQHAQRYLYDPGISVAAEALAVVETARVSAMHDPTEGGLSGGLYELSEAAGVGLEVDQAEITILDETRTLCQEFHLDPLGLIASGALLITCRPGDRDRLLKAVRAAGVAVRHIGRVVSPSRGVVLIGPEGEKFFPAFERDEIVKSFEK
jgi:hydrogenase maturation factor